MARKKITSKEYSEVTTGVRLSSHEKLCAERMKVLNENINELRKEVKSLRNDVSTGKGMVKVLVFLGTIIGTIIGDSNLNKMIDRFLYSFFGFLDKIIENIENLVISKKKKRKK